MCHMSKEELLCNPEYQNLLAIIDKEVDYVDVKEYSHNIISCALLEISEKFGRGATNDVIVEFELENLGWSQVNKEDDI